jgi:hypothetical protein
MGSVTLTAFPKSESEKAYLFATAEYKITMTVEFRDNFTDAGLRFLEQPSNRRFCLSLKGQEDLNCINNFTGSIAVARYKVVSHVTSEPLLSIREYVRSIDRGDSVPERPPFERVIRLQHGVASDIQAFGYQPSPSGDSVHNVDAENEWCLFRQDLYLKDKVDPFLIVHWKHTLGAIRVLDIIPGGGTWRLPHGKQGR